MYGTDGQTLMMTMEFQNLKFNVDLADELFAFNPPPGVPVMDMSEMMKRALGGTPPPAPPAP